MKPAPMPWMQVVARRACPRAPRRSRARPRRSRTSGFFCFRTSPTPVIVPPVPDAGDEHGDLAVGVVPDLDRGGASVDLGVGGVVELLELDRAGDRRRRARRP